MTVPWRHDILSIKFTWVKQSSSIENEFLSFFLRSLTGLSQNSVGRTEDVQKIKQNKKKRKKIKKAISLLNYFMPTKIRSVTSILLRSKVFNSKVTFIMDLSCQSITDIVFQ